MEDYRPEVLRDLPDPVRNYVVDGWEYWTYTSDGLTQHFAVRRGECITLDLKQSTAMLPKKAFLMLSLMGFPDRHSMLNIPDGAGNSIRPLDVVSIAALYAWKNAPTDQLFPPIYQQSCDEPLADYFDELSRDLAGHPLIFIAVALLVLAGIAVGVAILKSLTGI